MGAHVESFRLLAELALVLAGFTGVVVAFVGRERSFDPANRARLWTMFEFVAASITTVVFTLGGLNLFPAEAWPLLAAFYLLLLYAIFSFFRMLILRN